MEFTGWWYCIKADDIDNDGDQDILYWVTAATNATIKGTIIIPAQYMQKTLMAMAATMLYRVIIRGTMLPAV